MTGISLPFLDDEQEMVLVRNHRGSWIKIILKFSLFSRMMLVRTYFFQIFYKNNLGFLK